MSHLAHVDGRGYGVAGVVKHICSDDMAFPGQHIDFHLSARRSKRAVLQLLACARISFRLWQVQWLQFALQFMSLCHIWVAEN